MSLLRALCLAATAPLVGCGAPYGGGLKDDWGGATSDDADALEEQAEEGDEWLEREDCPQPTEAISLAEAWDREFADAWFDGRLNVENTGPYPISMDAWHIWFAEYSQDAAAGHADYAYGSEDAGEQGLVIEPGQTWSMDYTAESGPAWWCVERTQVTNTTDDFHFNGAQVPDVLMQYIFYDTDMDGDGVEDHDQFDPEVNAPQTQHNIWDQIADGPVFVVGRVPNYVELSPGQSTELVIEVVNLGRAAGSVTVSETIPAGSEAGEFTIEPAWEEANSDGSTTYWWAWKMAASEDNPDLSAPTDYDRFEIGYTLTWSAAACGYRKETWAPRADWADNDGRAHISWGTPLVIACCQ